MGGQSLFGNREVSIGLVLCNLVLAIFASF